PPAGRIGLFDAVCIAEPLRNRLNASVDGPLADADEPILASHVGNLAVSVERADRDGEWIVDSHIGVGWRGILAGIVRTVRRPQPALPASLVFPPQSVLVPTADIGA